MIRKLSYVLLFLTTTVIAQTNHTRTCGTMKHLEYMKQQDPGLEQSLSKYNQTLNEWIAKNPARNGERAMRTIPIVFHIIYNKNEENLSDAQILSQLKAMNEDFSRTNADTVQTPAGFKNVAGNPKIQFCLAKRDPSGKSTTGIVRIKTTETGFDMDDNVKFKSKGGDDAWDVTQYYNIWICNFNDQQLLGYGEFPTGTASNTFGYVGTYLFTGTTSNVDPPFNKGRTTTHEVGHTFNLMHIWGDDSGACTGSDECNDTPNQADASGGKPTFPLTDNCTNSSPGVMFMNYMDYSDDDAMNMFTKDQVARMDAVLSNAPYDKLTSSNACTPVTTIEEQSNNYELSIYPNPTDGNFTISFTANEKSNYVLELRNALGQSVYQEELNNFKGNYSKPFIFENVGKGVYMFSVRNQHELAIKRLIVY